MSASSAHSDSVLPDGLIAAIDRGDEIPIGVQLAWALRSCIRDGRVSPAQRLPGLRELADAVGVNANTVRSVYQRLEREGLIDSRQGSGTFVAAQPVAAAFSTVSAIAADAAREALAAGADPREVAAALYVAPGAERQQVVLASPDASTCQQAVDAPPGTADASTQTLATRELARRRALRTQIATLERAIAEMETEHPGVAPPISPVGRQGGPALLSAEELERVRSALVHRLAGVQAAIDEQAAIAARTVTATNRVATNKATTTTNNNTNKTNKTNKTSAKTAKQARKPVKPKHPRAAGIIPPRTAPC